MCLSSSSGFYVFLVDMVFCVPLLDLVCLCLSVRFDLFVSYDWSGPPPLKIMLCIFFRVLFAEFGKINPYVGNKINFWETTIKKMSNFSFFFSSNHPKSFSPRGWLILKNIHPWFCACSGLKGKWFNVFGNMKQIFRIWSRFRRNRFISNYSI